MIAESHVELPNAPSDARTEGLRRGLVVSDAPAVWSLSAFTGRLGEISGGYASAALTLAFRLVLEAQRQGEPEQGSGRQFRLNFAGFFRIG